MKHKQLGIFFIHFQKKNPIKLFLFFHKCIILLTMNKIFKKKSIYLLLQMVNIVLHEILIHMYMYVGLKDSNLIILLRTV